MTDTGHLEAAVIGDGDRGRHHHKNRVLGYVPGFVYILVLFVVGQLIFLDPRATLFNIGGYRLAWVEVLLLAAAIMAMAEQIKVATPGINNTTEVLLMGAMAIIQVVLFALAAANGLAGRHVELMNLVSEEATRSSGRILPSAPRP